LDRSFQHQFVSISDNDLLDQPSPVDEQAKLASQFLG